MDETEQEVLQKNLMRFLIRDVFNTITKEDILEIAAPNAWTHKGRKLTPGQIGALRSEAKAFSESGLWAILSAELRWLAHRNGYVKSKTAADQMAGKMLEYLTDVIDTKLKDMAID